MLKQTPLNAVHRAAGARMVDFGGWDMPVNYGSQIDEHHAIPQPGGLGIAQAAVHAVDAGALADARVHARRIGRCDRKPFAEPQHVECAIGERQHRDVARQLRGKAPLLQRRIALARLHGLDVGQEGPGMGLQRRDAGTGPMPMMAG